MDLGDIVLASITVPVCANICCVVSCRYTSYAGTTWPQLLAVPTWNFEARWD